MSKDRILVFGLVLLGGISVWLYNSKDKGPKPDSTTIPVAGQPGKENPASARQPPPKYRWVVGASQLYAFEFVRRLDAGGASTPGGQGSVNRYSGQFAIRVLGETDGNYLCAAQAKDVSATSQGIPLSQHEELLENQPALLEFTPAGKIVRVEVHPALTKERKTFLKDIYSIQIVLGENGGERWQTDEQDSVGTYLSSYTVNQGDPRINKIRESYTSLSQEAFGGLTGVNMVILSSEASATLGETWLQQYSAATSTALHLESGGVTAVFRSTNSETIQAMDGELPSLLMSLPLHAELGELAAVISAKALPEAWNTTKLWPGQAKTASNRSFDDIYQALTTAVATAERHSETMDELFALRDWIAANPDKTAMITAKLQSADLDPALSARLIHSLGLNIAHPDIQECLAEVMLDDSIIEGTRFQAIIAANGDDFQATPELIDALWTIVGSPDAAQRLASASLLSLGTISRPDPALRNKIEQSLTSVLSDPSAYGNRNLLASILALKNARSVNPQVVDLISGHASSFPDASIREASTRFLASSRQNHEPFLLERLAKDPDPLVQEAIVRNLGSREGLNAGTIQTLTSKYANNRDAAPSLRLAVIETLGSQIGAHPNIREALTSLQTDQNEEVSKAAESALLPVPFPTNGNPAKTVESAIREND